MAVRSRTRALTAAVMILLLAGGCAPGPMSFEQFHGSFCSAWDSLFRAVGNPDIGDGSPLTRAMDDAIAAEDIATVDRLAAQIKSELETGRQAVAAASRWEPATPMMAQLDLVLVGFEAMTEAKRAAASAGMGVAATQRGQEALEASGAIDAWFAMIRPGVLDETRRAIESARPSGGPQRCPNVPISL